MLEDGIIDRKSPAGQEATEVMMAIPFAKRVTEARNVVVLTGAGVSVASGLKPYRGPGGLWTTNPELASRLVAGVDAATLWTDTCCWRKELARAEPNAAHTALVAFEQKLIARGGAFTLITQNVDGLHTKAGSLNVIEFHGSLKRSRCAAACGAEPFSDERDEAQCLSANAVVPPLGLTSCSSTR